MDKKTVLTGLAVLAVVVLAAGFRFYDIKDYPPGLFPDEAANGEDVRLILNGDVRPFYPRGNGREALFFFLEAASIKLFGIGVWQLHIVSAAVGVLTVLAVYFATRVWFGRLSGLLAAGMLATNHWHVTMSRTGFRAILIPLFIALFTAFVGYTIRAVKRGSTMPNSKFQIPNKLQNTKSKSHTRRSITMSYVYAALAGAAFAGGFYTYIAYRVMAGVVLGVVLLMLLAALHPKIGWPHLVRYWQQLAIGCIAAAIVLAPLAGYFVMHPDAFVGRAGQVSVFNGELQNEYGGGTLVGTILYSTRETLAAFFIGAGDLNWRHNVPGYPLLNPLVGALFLLGLAWAINGTVMVFYKIVRGREIHLGMIFPYLLLIIAGMLAPVITTAEGMPHGLRSIGLLFPIFMLAGTAGSVIIYWLKLKVKQEAWRAAGRGAMAGLLILGLLYDGALYFMIARNDADAYYAYRGDLTTVAQFLNDRRRDYPNEPRPYLVLDKFSLQTVHFLTSVAAHEHTVGDEVHPDEAQHKWVQIDPATSHLWQLAPGEIMVFTQSTIFDADRYAKQHTDVELLESTTNRWGQEIMRVYKGVGQEKVNGDGSLDA
ncbi:MAG: glycosyltransferase family 39 protein [bacterium]|nr:glycosyltransferase family 39 protein [bacterium]